MSILDAPIERTEITTDSLDPLRALAASVIVQAVRDAQRGNVEAAYWLSLDDVLDTWGMLAGLSYTHVKRWLKELEHDRKRKRL